MIKKLLLFTLTLVLGTSAFGQNAEELKAKKAELDAQIKEKQGELSKLQGEAASIQEQLTILAGWRFGLSGLVGLDFGSTDSWIASPNPTSSSSALGISLTTFANRQAPKYFWNNKLIVNKAWQDIDVDDSEDDDLFDNGTTDILNLSSLGGYKLTEKIALSGLAELNTSIDNFLQPGSFDIGIGGTWTPIPNLVVVVHPLNYRIAWSAEMDASGEGAIGAKIRVDYQDDFAIASRKIAWSSTLTSFLPYSGDENPVPDLDKFGNQLTDANGENLIRDAGLFEYTWLNTFSFQIWKGIGTGVTFGLRDAAFEFDGLQTFYQVGVTYTL